MGRFGRSPEPPLPKNGGKRRQFSRTAAQRISMPCCTLPVPTSTRAVEDVPEMRQLTG